MTFDKREGFTTFVPSEIERTIIRMGIFNYQHSKPVISEDIAQWENEGGKV